MLHFFSQHAGIEVEKEVWLVIKNRIIYNNHIHTSNFDQ